MLKSFLNKIIKEDGFLLETSDKKIHIIGNPAKEKPIKLKFHSKSAEIKCALFSDYYLGKLFVDKEITTEQEEDISKILISAQVMDLNGKIRIIYSSDIKFGYRECNLDNNLIFISATFRGKKDNKINIRKKIDNLVGRKKNDQPSKIKTCGSTFKNPGSKKAWKLIKDSGCSGMMVGDAQISEKHCNFFVNKGNAKSKDLENLIQQVKSKVLDKTGINLQLELKII